MTANLTLILTASVMVGCGVYLLLERSLTRVLVGVVLMSNGVNLLLLVSGGAAGPAPLVDKANPDVVTSDPLPQALILTSIVISLAVTAFLLGMIYRSWVLGRRDEIQDDVEDRRVARQSSYDVEDDAEIPADTTEFDTSPGDEAAGRDPDEDVEAPGAPAAGREGTR